MDELIIAGVDLISQIVAMIQEAKTAKTEAHAAILTRLQAASLALATAADSAHKALAEETALDQGLVKA